MSRLKNTLADILTNSENEAFSTLEERHSTLQTNFTQQAFFRLFALCPRWFKSAKQVDTAELSEVDAFALLPQWQPAQLARLYSLLRLSECTDSSNYENCVNELFKSADVNELVALVQSLRFLPQPERFNDRAREAARSNIAAVFCAVAHDPDYAFQHFDDDGWNQLVLKAAFLAVPIWSIYGLRERNNAQLAEMLCHYAIERQAASRAVPWDLYCCPGWNANDKQQLDFLKQQFELGTKKIQAAITLALRENKNPQANTLAEELNITEEFTWQTIATMED